MDFKIPLIPSLIPQTLNQWAQKPQIYFMHCGQTHCAQILMQNETWRLESEKEGKNKGMGRERKRVGGRGEERGEMLL